MMQNLMKQKLLTLLCTAALLTSTAFAVANPFTDVPSTSAMAQPVLWALEEGITSGTSDTTFSPDSTCTRGQVVTFLWRAKGEPAPAISSNPFADVSSASPYYTAILWAVGEGITTGTDDGIFSPDATCTSGQVVTFLHRAMGEPQSTQTSTYAAGAATAYVGAINWADESNLLQDMNFSASAACPRSDVVTYLYRDAGSPTVNITESISTTLAYTLPSVSAPGTAALSADYFEQVFLYMMVNDLATYTCYFSGVSGSGLESQGLESLVDAAFFSVRDTHIDIGGFYGGYKWSWTGNSSATTLTLTLVGEGLTNAQAKTYKAAFLATIEDLVNGFFDAGEIQHSDSDYTKALYFYRWCACNLQYDTAYQSSSYHGYGALTNRTGVCQGYTAIFNAMCNVAGIAAYGTSGDGHIWSLVNLDGSWVYADATYGDPIPDRADFCDPSYFAVTRAYLESCGHVFEIYMDL